ncbi:Pal1 cell morphology protein-domain-containing protein [Mycena belliarum]|uniref:Pal1 cell morphology protein-domain-containing protein n=1 Tax=Mycena belliarum TaxID=1033014 RepID=A0AAD6XWB7_9AGAR|nr:Pal1 cell morphology protein-domain-containing protein [Mycena belliae]
MSAAVQSRPRPEDDPFADDKGSPTRSRSPPLPPKKSRQPSAPRSAPARDIAEEVRDTVVVRGSPNRVARSHTNALNTSAKPAPQLGPRSLSQDSVPVDKKSKSRKKGSQHADVIDRLDYTGVGPMFHHDGPFDACAPSRNRQKNRAPMMAWTPRPEDAPKEFVGDNPYPSPHAMAAFSTSDYEPPKKKVDAIAEAWGIHEPEPYEEFFAGGGGGTTPASSIYNGKESSRKTPESSRPRAHARRSQLPPPMPIFVPDGVTDNPALPDSPGSPNSYPKRNKSLMHRIRKMRDAPNVPVNDDETPAEANGDQPTHRSQNSLFGRFGNNGRAGTSGNANVSPSSENSESYVFIEPKVASKELPSTPGSAPPTSPGEHSPNGYFDDPDATSPSSGGGLGRKTSLMKKVGRVVRGTR